MMPRVIHLTSAHPVFDTRIFHKECKALVEAGYDVTLIAPGEGNQDSDGIHILGISPATGRWQRMILTSFRTIRAALALQADIYHLHDPELMIWIPVLRALGKRVIFDMHENMPLALLSKPYFGKLARTLVQHIYGGLEALLLHGVPVIFAEASYRKYYPRVGHNVIVLNMPRIETLTNISHPKANVFTVTYLGRVAKQRGSVVMLEALSLLQQSGIRVAFDCIGMIESLHEKELRKLCQKLDLKQVHFHGYQPPPRGWEITAKGHVGLAVLQYSPNYVESYPTKVFEYMALGLPVIVSRIPLYRSIVEKHQCGLCVDPTDAKELANAIAWLYRHPDEAEAMGQRGRGAVLTQYNWHTEEQKLIAFYEQVLAH